METTFIVLILVGIVLLGLSAGFLLAISIGIRRQDRRGGYRSLRDEELDSTLGNTGRYICGLRFRERRPAAAPFTAPSEDRAPTAA
ncbi:MULTISPECIES: hypothetical protein [Nocardiopsis]|uniref:Uncharacterized protein n=1 Tax=Nocardiopsis alba TaxID=53437 RepID=A0A7K2IV15_9ACTN|nr:MULTISPECIES: hypothetical protein [Nocardiopsis]MEC3895221.1 hypothetical protein [Nocardiopsis sp. LDBS1602]MYR33666.1 hypothetical protein [Nocardiopsis alba]